MNSGIARVFLYLKTNRNSINALAGALESAPFFFAGEEPGRVNKRMLPALKKLLASKDVFGAWRGQEKQARRIAAYFAPENYKQC